MDGIPCEAYYYRIGSSIRQKRQEKGLTQEGLAEAAGLSLMETIIRVAETLGVSLGSLADMRGKDERTVFCQEMFYELVRDKTFEEIRYAVGIVDSVFKLHRQYLE